MVAITITYAAAGSILVNNVAATIAAPIAMGGDLTIDSIGANSTLNLTGATTSAANVDLTTTAGNLLVDVKQYRRLLMSTTSLITPLCD